MTYFMLGNTVAKLPSIYAIARIVGSIMTSVVQKINNILL